MKLRVQTFLVLASLVLFAISCGAGKGKEDAAESGAATPVQVTAAKQEPIHSVVTVEAVLYPVKQANIVPKISAPVQRFLAGRGDHVRAGQLLAILENRDLAASAEESRDLYRQAQASYESTTAAMMPDDLTKAKTDVEAGRQAFEAARKVYENRQALLREGALAQKLVDDAKVAMVQAQAQYETAQQHLKSLEAVSRPEQLKSAAAQRDAAKAHYESAAAQASYAEIRSPIAGVVADRPVNIGDMGTSSSALFSIVDISRIVARASVPVQIASNIKVGEPVRLSAAGSELTGKVTVVSPAVDPNTTTVQIWAEAMNAGEHLKPGATVHISIDTGAAPNAIVVPASALLAAEDGTEKVMVVEGGEARNRKVEVGIRSGDDVQILTGIRAGEQIITQGALGLDDKAKVQIGTGEAGAKEEAGKGDKKEDQN